MKQFLLIGILLVTATPSMASFYPPVDAPTLLNINAGEVDVLDADSNPRFGIEYRYTRFGKWNLVPSMGFVATHSGASFLYTELRRDFRLHKHWLFTGSFGSGLFEEGEDLKLGHKLEFRSGIELAREFSTGHRLAVGFFHISNGSISDDNPGTESLVVSIMLPLNR